MTEYMKKERSKWWLVFIIGTVIGVAGIIAAFVMLVSGTTYTRPQCNVAGVCVTR